MKKKLDNKKNKKDLGTELLFLAGVELLKKLHKNA